MSPAQIHPGGTGPPVLRSPHSAFRTTTAALAVRLPVVTMSPESPSDACRDRNVDPNRPDLSLSSRPTSKWKTLLTKLKISKAKDNIEPSPVKLTQRNLEEYFNPDFIDEHDAFHRIQRPRKISIPEWIQLLP